MEGLDEALDLAASNDEWYLRIYVYKRQRMVIRDGIGRAKTGGLIDLAEIQV